MCPGPRQAACTPQSTLWLGHPYATALAHVLSPRLSPQPWPRPAVMGVGAGAPQHDAPQSGGACWGQGALRGARQQLLVALQPCQPPPPLPPLTMPAAHDGDGDDAPMTGSRALEHHHPSLAPPSRRPLGHRQMARSSGHWPLHKDAPSAPSTHHKPPPPELGLCPQSLQPWVGAGPPRPPCSSHAHTRASLATATSTLAAAAPQAERELSSMAATSEALVGRNEALVAANSELLVHHEVLQLQAEAAQEQVCERVGGVVGGRSTWLCRGPACCAACRA